MSHPARSHRHRRGYAARLALLVGAALTLLGVAAAPAALAQTPAQSSTTAAVAPWSDLSAAPALAALATADRMPAFDSAFVVDKDGGITVTETIQYSFDSSGGVRHGIYLSLIHI